MEIKGDIRVERTVVRQNIIHENVIHYLDKTLTSNKS